MTETGRSLVTDALERIGVVPAAQAADDDDADIALRALNTMLDAWKGVGLLVLEVVRSLYPLVSGTATYTIGPGGTFNTVRPLTIDRAGLVFFQATDPYERPLDILNLDQFQRYRMKSISGSIPQGLYNDRAYPLSTLTLVPKPSDSSLKLALYAGQPLDVLATLNTSVDLAPGYKLAIVTNLAKSLASGPFKKTLSDDLKREAVTSLGRIEVNNLRVGTLRCDPALLGRGAGYDIRSDG